MTRIRDVEKLEKNALRFAVGMTIAILAGYATVIGFGIFVIVKVLQHFGIL